MVYYNEIDPYAAQWLRNLIVAGHIAAGEVDERSICDVAPADLAGFTQCHFFAGIAGWPYALRLAGWSDDRPVWTGSCPCQPFSTATRGVSKRKEDPKHLWPVWGRLISERRPVAVFGEQVAAASDWFDEVCDDMEKMGYSIGASVLPACSVGFDHTRYRLYFVGDADLRSKPICKINAKAPWVPRHRGISKELALEDGVSRRMGAMRAYGNALVPQVAQAFIEAFMECRP